VHFLEARGISRIDGVKAHPPEGKRQHNLSDSAAERLAGTLTLLKKIQPLTRS
jgi:hypothetical protein